MPAKVEQTGKNEGFNANREGICIGKRGLIKESRIKRISKGRGKKYGSKIS